MSFHIRDAHTEDGPALVALLDQLGYPGTEAFIDRRLAQLLAHPDARTWVAEGSGRVLGVLSLHLVPQLALAGDFCRISYLCVDAAQRGTGVGAALVAAAEAEARRRGCDRIELHCHARRTAAHAFYAALGFEESPKYLFKQLA